MIQREEYERVCEENRKLKEEVRRLRNLGADLRTIPDTSGPDKGVGLD